MKICIFSSVQNGGTFLDWSIHFLSGCKQFYSTNLKKYVLLTQDPLTTVNAHNHQKNHPSGADAAKAHLETSNDVNNIYSMYAYPLHFYKVAEKHNISFDKENFDKILAYQISDTYKLFDECQQHDAKLIHLTGESFIPLYFSSVSRSDFSIITAKSVSKQKAREELDQFFFNGSISIWKNNNLTNVWDVREYQALNCRPLQQNHVYSIPQPHLRIDCREFWYNGITVINQTMDYLNLPIDTERLKRWREIYAQWQLIHNIPMSFCYNCDHIVNAIVNNWDYSINLTFEQEVIVQHFLIYKHNLNIKTWQLEKFPNNTRDLHKLLEPNIHQVPNLYL